MFWADEIAGEIENRFKKEIEAGTSLLIRDEKTLSGRVHVGSVLGIVIHGLLAEVLTERGIANEFRYELNDIDPMDGLPVYLDQETYEAHMGKPLFAVPAINEGEEHFGSGFGKELIEAVEPMGLPIHWYGPRPYYTDGSFNDCIRDALENAEAIRTIYLEVSGGKKADDWYPLNVVCEKCGKLGTTKVTGWNGEKVTYTCMPQYVEWAEGCGHQGELDPFDGRSKLPWKVEWAAKWKVLGVNIEAAGKDHYAAGGSREISARISEEIYKYPEPFGFLYEFFNFQGKKMSASKGLGATAKDMSDLLPPELLKFLMIRKPYNRPLNFDPEGKTVPNTFDEYDRCSDHYFKRIEEPYEDFARAFRLAHPSEPSDLWQMRFSTMIFAVQMPHIDLKTEAEHLKESPLSNEELQVLERRAHYVKYWVENYASDDYRYTILEDVPEDLDLSDEQTSILQQLATALEALNSWDGPSIHKAVHDIKKEMGIEPKQLFQALYQLFLGRTSGPQIGWFLSTFEQSAVLERLRGV